METLPAKKKCLKCGYTFDSQHRKKEWVCGECKRSTEWKESSPLAPEGHGDAYDLSEVTGAY